MGDRRADEGQIFIGDMPIDKMDLKALRRKITRIRHDSYLFAGTIRENLLMGKEDATETQMKEALREVNLLDFVEKSGGLDFVLLEKASNLSGGQKQRLSLARALLHDTPIYIFDEATSNVDVESENDIMAVVRKLAKTKTVLLISHRLANVVSADQIYVLKDGMIVEKGQHEAFAKKMDTITDYSDSRAHWSNLERGRLPMNKNRNGFQVMLGLIGMIKPLLGVMCIAIIMGCIGNLMAIFITILGGAAIGNLLGEVTGISMKMIFVLLVVFAVLRGVLRYAEQASNHYIAFKLLARIRHQIFASLRKLAPAKLDGKEKGNLISIITSDIELLEVFYAHTISPIAIAAITSLVMVAFIGQFHVGLGGIGGGVLSACRAGRSGGEQ